MKIIILLLSIALSSCGKASDSTPVESYLNCIGVSTTIILLDKDNISKAWESTGKTIKVWKEIREHFIKVVVAKKIATGESSKNAQLDIARYVEAGSKIYLKAATSKGKLDMDRNTFEKATGNCLRLYGI